MKESEWEAEPYRENKNKIRLLGRKVRKGGDFLKDRTQRRLVHRFLRSRKAGQHGEIRGDRELIRERDTESELIRERYTESELIREREKERASPW